MENWIMSKLLTRKEIANLSPTTLKDLAERGIIQVMTNSQPFPTTIEETPEFKKNAKLKGTPIHQSAACRKYDVALSTMSQWVSKGIVPVLGKDKNKIMLDEAYVAYAATVLKSKTEAKGRWLFDENKMPYHPSTVRNR
jgi:hypothetical protein